MLLGRTLLQFFVYAKFPHVCIEVLTNNASSWLLPAFFRVAVYTSCWL